MIFSKCLNKTETRIEWCRCERKPPPRDCDGWYCRTCSKYLNASRVALWPSGPSFLATSSIVSGSFCKKVLGGLAAILELLDFAMAATAQGPKVVVGVGEVGVSGEWEYVVDVLGGLGAECVIPERVAA